MKYYKNLSIDENDFSVQRQGCRIHLTTTEAFMHIFFVYAGLVDFCRKLCYFDAKMTHNLQQFLTQY